MAMSESRAAGDTRHRVSYPNSRPRAIKLIGLGQGGRRIAEAIAGRGLGHVEAIAALAGSTDGQAIVDEDSAIGRAIREADMVFLVAQDGDNVTFASAIGRMAHGRGVLVTGMLIQTRDAGSSVPDSTLGTLRSASDMLVMVTDADYVAEMLGALGAQ
ncbi:MAG: hypothetical protein ABJC33_06020 [Betaproteobacteria bacterium]